MYACYRPIGCLLLLLIGILGYCVLLGGDARAAGEDSNLIVTLNVHVHLRTRPFWLDYERPHSRYFATLDACVDPAFATVPSNARDFGDCFVLQDAKPGYEPISIPADNDYLQSHTITYWTQTIRVVLPDQFAHTLDVKTHYVFHDRGQTGPDSKPAILADTIVLQSEVTLSASDAQIDVPMDGSIPHEQWVHFLFHPVGTYDHSLSFWGCLRRPAPGLPSAYCGKMAAIPNGSFQLDAKISTPLEPASLFSPTVDPLLEGTNIQMSIVAAPPGPLLPDAQPAPPGLDGHPANQIVGPVDSPLDCAMASALTYADQTLECSAAIKHTPSGQWYLSPTKVRAYIGVPPSFTYEHCVICTSTQPWPYAGPVLLALLLLVVGAGGVATMTYLGRVPATPSSPSSRPLARNPTFVGCIALALVSLGFLISGAVNFRAGYQPVVPGQIRFEQTPGAGPAVNAVPPTPTFTPSPTRTVTPTPKPSPGPSPHPKP